ncbi:hypothetical protein K4K49_007229 [Colletotrichum sp. SAR 10_70]|nr:hypothetical protein K4K50_007642 [Colletotrichum sp. SAR 10_71]KAI8160631.1 hypothetical protein K4K49_007229 [Colletotrichum sp. SAR 10_70]
MSQGIINKCFKDTFDTVKGTDETMYTLFLSTKQSGTLKAPSVVLMGNASQMVEVWDVLHFNSGMVELKCGRNTDLAGWTLTVSKPLKKVTLTPDENSPGLRAEKELVMHTLGAK